MTDSLRDTLKKIQDDDVKAAANAQQSRMLNILEEIRVALEDDNDVDDALRIVQEALGLPTLPPFCIDCGENRADPPSERCPGCDAYKEHQ